jgi:hypothetical protein
VILKFHFSRKDNVMKRFKLTMLLAVVILLGSAATAVAGTLKLTAVPGSPAPDATGSVGTTYKWVPPYVAADTRFAFRGLTPGVTYYLYGDALLNWHPITLIATFTADANGNAKGEAIYVYPFNDNSQWTRYYVAESLTGKMVMASH